MRYLMVAIIALLVPAAAMAKGECKADKKKFCADVTEKADVIACFDRHMPELSAECKTLLEAKAKKKNTEGSAKMGKEEGTHTGQGGPSESDTSKVVQPERRNPTTGTETPKQ